MKEAPKCFWRSELGQGFKEQAASSRREQRGVGGGGACAREGEDHRSGLWVDSAVGHAHRGLKAGLGALVIDQRGQRPRHAFSNSVFCLFISVGGVSEGVQYKLSFPSLRDTGKRWVNQMLGQQK